MRKAFKSGKELRGDAARLSHKFKIYPELFSFQFLVFSFKFPAPTHSD